MSTCPLVCRDKMRCKKVMIFDGLLLGVAYNYKGIPIPRNLREIVRVMVVDATYSTWGVGTKSGGRLFSFYRGRLSIYL